MNRRKARENAFVMLFAASFGEAVDALVDVAREEEEPFAVDEFGEGLINLYETNKQAIDEVIAGKLKGWKAERLPRVSLAILRLSVAEMLYGPKDMDSVIINEAVELAKKFGSDGDYQFINGVLGAVSREAHPEQAILGEECPDEVND